MEIKWYSDNSFVGSEREEILIIDDSEIEELRTNGHTEESRTGYGTDFNHGEYWDWVRMMSVDNIVICSEYNAPDDFVCIYEKGLTTTMDNASRKKDIERLFVYKNNKGLIK